MQNSSSLLSEENELQHVPVLWVYGYKLLIPCLIQRTIDHMLKGKSYLDFNEFNQVAEKFNDYSFSDRAFPVRLSC